MASDSLISLLTWRQSWVETREFWGSEIQNIPKEMRHKRLFHLVQPSFLISREMRPTNNEEQARIASGGKIVTVSQRQKTFFLRLCTVLSVLDPPIVFRTSFVSLNSSPYISHERFFSLFYSFLSSLSLPALRGLVLSTKHAMTHGRLIVVAEFRYHTLRCPSQLPSFPRGLQQFSSWERWNYASFFFVPSSLNVQRLDLMIHPL